MNLKNRYRKEKDKRIVFDTLGIDSDILPRRQKWAVVSFIEPDVTRHELFYSYAFDLFIRKARGNIKKIILNGDKMLDKKSYQMIYEKMDSFKAMEAKRDEMIKIDDKLSELRSSGDEKIKRMTDVLSELKDEVKRKVQLNMIKRTHVTNQKRVEAMRVSLIENVKKFSAQRLDHLNEEITKRLNITTGIFHEKNMEYIISYFKEFINVNYDFINGKFQSECGDDFDVYSMTKIWGVFPSQSDAQKFVKINKERVTKFGSTYIQPMGAWNIINPKGKEREDEYYLNEKTKELLEHHKINKQKARNDFKYRREVLKEYESVKSGIKYKSYKRDINENVSSKNYFSDDKLIMPKKFKDKGELEKAFEFFNPIDRYNLIISRQNDTKENELEKNIARDIIRKEIESGKTIGYINPIIMKKLGMNKDLIEIVEKKNVEKRIESVENRVNSMINSDKIKIDHNKEICKNDKTTKK